MEIWGLKHRLEACASSAFILGVFSLILFVYFVFVCSVFETGACYIALAILELTV